MPRVRAKPDPPSCGPPPGANRPGPNLQARGGARGGSSGASSSGAGSNPYPWSHFSPDQTKQYLEVLPKSLNAQEKMLALAWQETCFCCSAQLTLGTCWLAFQQSFLKGKGDTETLGHWALNLLKFLNTNPEMGSNLLLKMDLLRSVTTQLDNKAAISEMASNGFKLPIDPLFTQQFNCPRQLPLATTIQVVFLDLLSTMTETSDGVRAFITGTPVLTMLLLVLRSSNDDRFNACALQLLWQIFQTQEELGLTDLEVELFATNLVDGGIVPVLTRLLTTSRNANVLKAAASLVCSVMLTQQFHAFGVLGPNKPDAVLRCGGRALVKLQEAGLEKALVSVLALKPSQLTFWVNVNFVVMGAAYLELQAVTLGVLRALLQAATNAGRPCGKDFVSSPVVTSWLAARGPPAGSSEQQQLAVGGEGASSTSSAAAAAEGGVAAAAAGDDGTASSSGDGSTQQILPESSESVVISMLKLLERNVGVSGVALEDMDPKERNLTPDFRFVQIQKIRQAATAAKQAQAGASASKAVDFLTKAIQDTKL